MSCACNLVSLGESKRESLQHKIDHYHAAAVLDLKRGWTGIDNELKIKYAF